MYAAPRRQACTISELRLPLPWPSRLTNVLAATARKVRLSVISIAVMFLCVLQNRRISLKTGGYRWDPGGSHWKTGICEDLIDMGTFRVSTEIASDRTELTIEDRVKCPRHGVWKRILTDSQTLRPFLRPPTFEE